MTVDGLDAIDERLSKLGRPVIRRIVEAGARADANEWRKSIRQAGHIRTGDMLESVEPGNYIEFLGGGEQESYPSDFDRKGIRNATKAYVINYGRGKRTARMGDKFITGKEKQFEDAVHDAMMAESDRIIDEINR